MYKTKRKEENLSSRSRCRANEFERVNDSHHAPSCRRMMKLGDLIVALDINCGTYVPHTKRDEEGLMTFAIEVDAS